MKVVGTEYSFDGSRLTVFFTSEQRVDFRQLVRDLARDFKTHIDLRQIGVRDEAKIVGGVGRCGRPLCCATWLSDFSPVSIRMAKAQDLPLSPMEISGLCGRLLCCLTYEHEYYHEVKSRFPKVGKMITSPLGPAKVIKVSVLRERATLLFEDGSTAMLSAEQIAGEAPIDAQQVEAGRRPAMADRVDEALTATLARPRQGAAPGADGPRVRRRLADVVPEPSEDDDWTEGEAGEPEAKPAARPAERVGPSEQPAPPAVRPPRQRRQNAPRREDVREQTPDGARGARSPAAGRGTLASPPAEPAPRSGGRRSRRRRGGGGSRGLPASGRETNGEAED
jgi:hypothetical protein